MNQSLEKPTGNTEFARYLRTGKWRILELKFNPYHDPQNGRFTYASGGVRSGSANATPPKATATVGAKLGKAPVSRFSPLHPANHGIHVVKKGDTLSGIAATRKGLKLSDLAEFMESIRLTLLARGKISGCQIRRTLMRERWRKINL
jgi:hypothetical protein